MEPQTERTQAQPARTGGAQKLNGIDRDALFSTIEAIKADPSKASCKFYSRSTWQNGTVSSCKISRYTLGGADIPQDHTLMADEPAALLGTDSAPNPQMLLYAALSSCVLNTFVVSASARGIAIEELTFDLEGELDLRGFLGIDETINPGYDELTLVCRVRGNGTREQYQACLDAGTRYSPNFQSLTKPVNVKYRLDMA